MFKLRRAVPYLMHMLTGTRGRHGWCLGDVMHTSIGVADLGGRILKWPKTDEKL